MARPLDKYALTISEVESLADKLEQALDVMRDAIDCAKANKVKKLEVKVRGFHHLVDAIDGIQEQAIPRPILPEIPAFDASRMVVATQSK